MTVDQLDLMGAAVSVAASCPIDTRTEQKLHLARVTKTIGTVVLEFCRAVHGRVQPEFHAEELRKHVIAQGFTAPASPDRVLRALRQKGLVSYAVVDRAASLYRVTQVQA